VNLKLWTISFFVLFKLIFFGYISPFSVVTTKTLEAGYFITKRFIWLTLLWLEDPKAWHQSPSEGTLAVSQCGEETEREAGK
jgi:hypothetical protein